MKITIIVPVFNAGKFLEDALASIFNNEVSGHELEIILIDDRSIDTITLALLAQYEKNPKDTCHSTES